jgi:hypothetical protein
MGFKKQPLRMHDRPPGGFTEVPVDDFWALIPVLAKAMKDFGPEQVRVSSTWAAQATRKIPVDRLPDGDTFLDLAARPSRN